MFEEIRGVDGPVQAGRWAWVIDGARGAVFLRPRWPRADVSPWALVLLVVTGLALSVLLQRLMFEGSARFYWQAVSGGWLATAITLWLCWLAARSAEAAGEAPRVSTLFAMIVVLGFLIGIPIALLTVVMVRSGLYAALPHIQWAYWGLYAFMSGWVALAGIWLLARQARHWLVRGAVVLGQLLSVTATVLAPGAAYWYPDARADAAAKGDEPESEPLKLTQALMEAQSGTLIQALDAIQPQRPGMVDLYAITFAPYASEDVFSREVDMVSEVMRSRFDTGGRQIQLQNHDQTAATMPWATPLNLQRAIERAAQRMDLGEDILFLHLTSHGARNGHLAAAFYPIDVDEVTPQQLRTWLDEAGVRYSVISISACFSGSWVAPLSAPGTLVMTAADADHTSYGCGRKSPLTFFGRAVFDEQLRNSTRSFETAHAAARKLIDQREKEAGKTDGYSNPQIAVGGEIRARLAELEARLATSP